jgi:DNA-binding response OmpR family regulator
MPHTDPKPSMLIVDDDPTILEYLSQYFLRRSYAVTIAHDGEEGQRMAVANNYDMIILDNAIPKKTGSQVCAHLRNTGITTPVIILSAQADVWNKTELLNIGADDYATKPFHVDELVARVNSLLRRAGKVGQPKPLVAADIIMDRSGHSVTRSGNEVYLTAKEFKILELLMERKGLLVPRETIVKHIWGIHANPSTHSLDTHLVNLRKKLCLHDRPNVITTVPGVGYRFF